jgi:hypothetical protein
MGDSQSHGMMPLKRTDCFVMYTSLKEIPTALMDYQTNPIINLFKDIKTIELFKALHLPVKQILLVKSADKWQPYQGSAE